LGERKRGSRRFRTSYFVAVAPFFVTSFWTRQLINSATQISFSDGHAMA
jgi:hypothetical protein